MDVHCAKCGQQSHIDADFLYAVRCPYCKQIYGVAMNVMLVPVTEEQVGPMNWKEADKT